MIKLSYFIVGYCVYLVFGALIFYELNFLEERKQHIHVNNQIRQFIYRNRKCLKEHDLYSYVDYFLDKSHTGLWLSVLNVNRTKWTFEQGLFFTTSLLTTVGYGSVTLMTSYGKILCIVYTSIGLIMALVFQQILHRLSIPIIYNLVFRIARHRYMIFYSTKQRTFSLAFLLVLISISLIFILIPTLFIYYKYVHHWSLIQLTYFVITTNHLIGFGDFMPCSHLHGEHRSNCTIIMTIYVIIQVLTASILSHMCWIFPLQSREYFLQRRHNSDCTVYLNVKKKSPFNLSKQSLFPNVFT